MVLKNIDDENAGKYRQIQCYISGDEEMPPKAKELDLLMNELIDWYNKNIDKIHPCIFVSEFHYKFVKIHPFIDGNGRTIRILLNMILMKKGYPMIIIPPIKRSEYIGSLNSTSNINNFNLFMLDTKYKYRGLFKDDKYRLIFDKITKNIKILALRISKCYFGNK